jgi:hypothetical protein
MAFIRWKKNKFGIRQAYLIHSYRDENGRPKHKTLAYLGSSGSLTPELISSLKDKHKDVNVNWEGIKEAPCSSPKTDITQLSDWDLARKLRELRRERGIHIRAMVERLQQIGAPSIKTVGEPEPMSLKLYGWLERGWQKSTHPEFVKAATLLAPYIRKCLDRSAQ